MAKKLMSVTVRGKEKTWGFNFYGDPKYLKEWRADGLEIVEVCNSIPVWVVDLGLITPWCIAQDVFNFKFRDAWTSLRHAFRKKPTE